MRKKSLQDDGMTDGAYIEHATDWARRLTQHEARGPGDIENAWHRLEARYGVPWRTFWALRYRPPRKITVAVFQRLYSAYQSECERQMRRLHHDLETTKAKAGAFHPAVVAAEAVVGESKNEEQT